MKVVKIFIEKNLNDDDKKLKLYEPEQRTISCYKTSVFLKILFAN